MGRAVVAGEHQLVSLVTGRPERSPGAVVADVEGGDRSPPASDAAAPVDLPHLERGARRTDVGGEQVGLAGDADPSPLRHHRGRARRPPGEELVELGERLGRRRHLHVTLIRRVPVGGADHLTGRIALAPHRQRRHPARRRGRRPTVDVDVVGHGGRPLGRAGEVALRHERAQGVAEQVDLVGTSLVAQRRDQLVEPGPHVGHRVRAERRVVVVHGDAVDRVAVARQPERLRLELRPRAEPAVDEHHRPRLRVPSTHPVVTASIVVDGGAGGRGGERRHQHQHGAERTDELACHAWTPRCPPRTTARRRNCLPRQSTAGRSDGPDVGRRDPVPDRARLRG